VAAGRTSETAWIEVTDDGIGFDVARLADMAADGHMGLRGLEGIVHDAGGQIDLASSPGSGTTVRVEVPV
jgi:signal transduction histidine kinase